MTRKELYDECYMRFCTELSHDKNDLRAKAMVEFIEEFAEKEVAEKLTELGEILNVEQLVQYRMAEELEKIRVVLQKYNELRGSEVAVSCMLDDLEVDVMDLKQK